MAKINLKIIINQEYVNFIDKNIEVKGKGTIDDPCTLDSEVGLPDSFEIYDSRYFLKINNLKLYSLGLFHCSNITVENCTFECMELSRVSEITLRHVICNDLFKINQSGDCLLENCTIEYLRLFKSHNITFKNNIFHVFENEYDTSRNNRFGGNEVPPIYMKEIMSSQLPLEVDRKTIDLQIYIGPRRFSTQSLSDYEFECEGLGTIDNPFIISTQKTKHFNVSVSQYRYYLIFSHMTYNPKFLTFNNCKHVSIKDCKYKVCEFYYCDDFKIRDISTDLIRIGGKCGNIIIENSIIGKIKVRNFIQGNIIFKNCKIKKSNKKVLTVFKFQNCIIDKNMYVGTEV